MMMLMFMWHSKILNVPHDVHCFYYTWWNIYVAILMLQTSYWALLDVMVRIKCCCALSVLYAEISNKTF